MKREHWLDGCRFFAFLFILIPHYVATFRPEALRLWEEPPASLLLGGFTAKLFVGFFFLLLGYFSSAPRRFEGRDFLRYALRRYGQFAFFVFAATLFFILGSYGVTWLFHRAQGVVLRVISDGARYNLLYLLRDSFLFEDNYIDTLWCMPQLFVSSLVCRALGCIPENRSLTLRLLPAAVLTVCSLLLGVQWVWLGAAVLGYVLRLALALAEKRPPLRSKAVRVGLLLLALALVKLPLSEQTRPLPTYAVQSLGAAAALFALFCSPGAQKLPALRPFPWLGRLAMGLFVVHTPVIELLSCSVFPLLSERSPGLALALCFPLSLGLSILAAWLMHRAYSILR